MPKNNTEFAQISEPVLFHGMTSDRMSLEELFSSYRGRLYRTALQLMGNPDDAEDAVQDALLSAYVNLSRFEGRSQFSTWITSIVINTALMYLRRKRSLAAVSLNQYPNRSQLPLEDRMQDSGPNPEELCEKEEQVEILRRGLQILPAAHRKPLWMCDVQGMRYREAAEALGVPIGSFKAQLHRARRRLRKKISVVQRTTHGI